VVKCFKMVYFKVSPDLLLLLGTIHYTIHYTSDILYYVVISVERKTLLLKKYIMRSILLVIYYKQNLIYANLTAYNLTIILYILLYIKRDDIYIFIYLYHFTDTTASTLTRVSAKTVIVIKLKPF